MGTTLGFLRAPQFPRDTFLSIFDHASPMDVMPLPPRIAVSILCPLLFSEFRVRDPRLCSLSPLHLVKTKPERS